MSTGKNSGFLSYDPGRAAVADAILAEGTGINGAGVGDDTGGAGGGLITATGTFYSKPTQLSPGSNSDVSDLVIITGASLTGTVVGQVSNDNEDADRNGTSDWGDYTAAQLIAGSGKFLFEAQRVGFARYRLKTVITAVVGSGTIKSRRVTKGS